MIEQKVQLKVLAVTAVVVLSMLLSSWSPWVAVTGADAVTKESPILKKIEKRGFLRCGVAPDNTVPGFRNTRPDGQLEGFDIDFCKALAVAIFNDEARVEYAFPATWSDRFTLLQDGKVDVLIAVATETASRDSELGVDFPAAYFYENYLGGVDTLGPAVGEGDSTWTDIVRWVVYGMINAEELGVNSANVLQLVNNPPEDPRVQSLLGLQNDVGIKLGLKNDFMVNVIHCIGNYGEVYARNLEIIFPRAGSLNALWSEGGLIHAPSMR